MNSDFKKYIEKQPSLQKEILNKIKELVLKIVPEAKESMSYGVPALKLNKNIILFAGFKEHIGLYPEPKTIEFFQKELAGYETSKGAIKFKLSKPIPYGLIEKIIRYRYNQITTELPNPPSST